MSYVHRTDLDDAEKPWRRVWQCATGFHVKTHAKQKPVGFGRIHWTITGSLCDELGKALPAGADSYMILEEPHELVIQNEGDMTPAERTAYVREHFDAALLVIVRRVEAAAINRDAAAAL